MSKLRDDAWPSPGAVYITELVEAWRRGGADVTDWASFEATPGYDRASVTRAWTATDDPFSMLLLLAVMHLGTARARDEAVDATVP